MFINISLNRTSLFSVAAICALGIYINSEFLNKMYLFLFETVCFGVNLSQQIVTGSNSKQEVQAKIKKKLCVYISSLLLLFVHFKHCEDDAQ